MKKIFVLGRDKVGWSIDEDRNNVINFINSLDDFKITKNIFNADIIYCVWYNILLKPVFYYLLKMIKLVRNVKVIAVITNDITKSLESSNNFKKLKNSRLINYWVVSNKKMKHYLNNGCNIKNVIVIPYYIDEIIYKKEDAKKENFCRIFDINYNKVKDKLLIGSFQRDSQGFDLSIPKWQKNPKGLFNIIKEFKDEAVLILAGPRRHWIINMCKKNNIPYIFIGNKLNIDNNKDDIHINNLDSFIINLLYNMIDIYLVTSISESGPKAILEASLCKTFILSTDVGLASEILHEDLIIDDRLMSKKLMKLYKDKNKYIEYNYNNVNKKISFEELKSKYKKLLNEV